MMLNAKDAKDAKDAKRERQANSPNLLALFLGAPGDLAFTHSVCLGA